MRTEAAFPGGRVWLDLEGPSQAELEALAAEWGLHATSVRDCMQPDHLSKFEQIGDTAFLLIRVVDGEAIGDSLRAITHKVACFLHPRGLLTVHRTPQPFLAALQAEVRAGSGPKGPREALTAVVQSVLHTFEEPLLKAEALIDQREQGCFDRRHRGLPIKHLHGTKRRIRLMRRSLSRTHAAILDLKPVFEGDRPHWQDLKEQAERLLAHADELLDAAVALVNLELNLEAQRTNEVMRLLTIFSAFFLPLTFIAGIYGMNFERMPELRSPYGYPASLAFMALTALGVFLWFRKRGWLR
ncbi:MAG TPA: CorA family divalent cation transporter [Holophagaceae bacterium]|nr:CorA family divalent cation transporter [Holophagaceae bacterium]